MSCARSRRLPHDRFATARLIPETGHLHRLPWRSLKGAEVRMALWRASGRVRVVAQSMLSATHDGNADGTGSRGTFMAVYETDGPRSNPLMQPSIRPVVIKRTLLSGCGSSAEEAEQSLRAIARALPLAQAIVSALREGRQPERLTTESQNEIEAFAAGVASRVEATKFGTMADLGDFAGRAQKPASELLALIEGDQDSVLLRGILAYTAPPDELAEPEKWRGAVEVTRRVLRALACGHKSDPKPKGRRVQATQAESVALALIQTWADCFGDDPDFAKRSRLMRVAVPALAFYNIRKADPAQFLRETWAKAGKLVPMRAAT